MAVANYSCENWMLLASQLNLISNVSGNSFLRNSTACLVNVPVSKLDSSGMSRHATITKSIYHNITLWAPCSGRWLDRDDTFPIVWHPWWPHWGPILCPIFVYNRQMNPYLQTSRFDHDCGAAGKRIGQDICLSIAGTLNDSPCQSPEFGKNWLPCIVCPYLLSLLCHAQS